MYNKTPIAMIGFTLCVFTHSKSYSFMLNVRSTTLESHSTAALDPCVIHTPSCVRFAIGQWLYVFIFHMTKERQSVSAVLMQPKWKINGGEKEIKATSKDFKWIRMKNGFFFLDFPVDGQRKSQNKSFVLSWWWLLLFLLFFCAIWWWNVKLTEHQAHIVAGGRLCSLNSKACVCVQYALEV